MFVCFFGLVNVNGGRAWWDWPWGNLMLCEFRGWRDVRRA